MKFAGMTYPVLHVLLYTTGPICPKPNFKSLSSSGLT